MKKITAVLLIGITTLFFTACEKKAKMDSAFGIKFGEVIKIDENSESILRSDKKMYKINPPSKMDLYDDYYVGITPTTHKVYSIYATKLNKTQTECSDNFYFINDLLIKKYGETEEIKNSSVGYTIMTIGTAITDDGFILYSCNTSISISGPTKHKSEIYYSHSDLGDLREKETMNLIKNKDAL